MEILILIQDCSIVIVENDKPLKIFRKENKMNHKNVNFLFKFLPVLLTCSARSSSPVSSGMSAFRKCKITRVVTSKRLQYVKTEAMQHRFIEEIGMKILLRIIAQT